MSHSHAPNPGANFPPPIPPGESFETGLVNALMRIEDCIDRIDPPPVNADGTIDNPRYVRDQLNHITRATLEAILYCDAILQAETNGVEDVVIDPEDLAAMKEWVIARMAAEKGGAS